MARTKSFRGGKKIDEFEPVEFELNDETFRCKRAIQGAVILEFVNKADSESGGEAAGALWNLFRDVMSDSEYKRFLAYVNQDDLIIGMDTLGEIAAWLVEEYTSRPTTGSEPSETGLSSSGPSSTEQLSSAV